MLSGNSETEAEVKALIGIFYFLLAADEEHQQNVAAAAAAAGARARAQGEERAEGVPRRRRNMGSRLMAQRRAQQAEEWLQGNPGFSSPCTHGNKPSQPVVQLGEGVQLPPQLLGSFAGGLFTVWP